MDGVCRATSSRLVDCDMNKNAGAIMLCDTLSAHLYGERTLNVLLDLSPADEGRSLLHADVARARGQEHRRVGHNGGRRWLERPLVSSPRLTRLSREYPGGRSSGSGRGCTTAEKNGRIKGGTRRKRTVVVSVWQEWATSSRTSVVSTRATLNPRTRHRHRAIRASRPASRYH